MSNAPEDQKTTPSTPVVTPDPSAAPPPAELKDDELEAAAGGVRFAESFGFGVEREMKESGEKG
jgi:hypothetical protein